MSEMRKSFVPSSVPVAVSLCPKISSSLSTSGGVLSSPSHVTRYSFACALYATRASKASKLVFPSGPMSEIRKIPPSGVPAASTSRPQTSCSPAVVIDPVQTTRYWFADGLYATAGESPLKLTFPSGPICETRTCVPIGSVA